MTTYSINEIFYSLQGEGMRCGQMSVFVRFAGCNLRCRMEAASDSPGGFDCDTEFVSSVKMTDKEILERALALVNKDQEWLEENPVWVVFTGGEPALQLTRELVELFRQHNFRSAIETNGSRDVSALGLDWITVSPKVAEHAIQQKTATEIKYVRGYGQGIPKPACIATFKLLSPAFNGLELDQDALRWCIELVRQNPDWRLSMQQHKQWRVR